ncbi:MAG TPA: HAD-IIB family hydrolase [Prolixibacteraceae bacterium]|jgi:hypothetical protein
MKYEKMLKLVATDLDGTFLKNDKSISKENLDTLHSLGERGILRVIATGRNLIKTQEVIAQHIPFDYIVFSSGAGVYDCRNEKLLFYQNINKTDVQNLSAFLVAKDLNFHLFKPVPENYKCWYHRGSVVCSEFERYFYFHQAHAEELQGDQGPDSEACQFLVVFSNIQDRFHSLKDEIQANFPAVKVVRTSSPLETEYTWMEIFHHSVSKGNGVKFLCDRLQIGHEYTLGIGNDFNDLDLLEFTRYSYMVDNGPAELKERFLSTRSNEESAFAMAVANHLG